MNTTLVMAYFYPVVVRGLGYTNPIKAQYMTVPIWVVAFVFAMVSGFVGDYRPARRPFLIMGGFGLLTVMAIGVCSVYGFTERYVLLAFMTGGAWVGFSQCTAYLAELFAPDHPQVRALCFGIVAATAQIGNIYGAYLFPAENAPKHLLGFGMVAGTSGLCVFIFAFVYWKERREKARRQDICAM
jgi:predicted MFS family arabinose efflux permease